MNTIKLLPAILLLPAVAHAAAVANYDFTSVTDPNESTETFLSASIDTNFGSVASDITSPATHDGGAVHPEFGDPFDNGGDQTIGWSARGSNPSQTFGINTPIDTYFSFNVAAVPGASLSFTSLTLTTGVTQSLTGTTAYDYTLTYSIDGINFAPVATIAAGGSSGDAATQSAAGITTADISFDLSGLTPLQDFAGTAYFQLEPVAASGAAQNGVLSQRGGFIDDLVVNATVVPEPTAAALGLLGALGLLRRRR